MQLSSIASRMTEEKLRGLNIAGAAILCVVGATMVLLFVYHAAEIWKERRLVQARETALAHRRSAGLV